MEGELWPWGQPVRFSKAYRFEHSVANIYQRLNNTDS